MQIDSLEAACGADAEVSTTPRLRTKLVTSPDRQERGDPGSASEQKVPSEVASRQSFSATSRRSPVRSTSPGSTHVARLLSTPRTTNSSSWSCTSIATPETRRSRKSWSPSPDVFADSELELSLELVNHVPPHVADRLMDRLRAAEAARQLVENQCEEADSAPSRFGNFRLPGLPWLSVSGSLFLCAQAFLQGSSPQSFQPAQQLGLEAPTDVAMSWASDDLPAASDVNFTCEAFLWEAENEALELQRRHEQLQAAFSSALEAASNWVGFLQKASQRPSDESGQDHELCVEAARPGQAALQALIQNGSQ